MVGCFHVVPGKAFLKLSVISARHRRSLATHIVARLSTKSNQWSENHLSSFFKRVLLGSFSEDNEIVGVQVVISACKLSPNAKKFKSSDKKGPHIFCCFPELRL